MEYKRNADAVKLLFKMKDIEKMISSTSNHLRGIKVPKSSMESYNRCHNIYKEGSIYFYQCCGFLKSRYFENNPSLSGKNFFINNLYIPAYKRFLSLKHNLSLIEVSDIYAESFRLLKDKVDYINASLSALLNEFIETQQL
ncbi:hypothetical protein [Fonticella tunisiensis]|uniref:Uncharacterized protein n=1 Tax=Fonticella tunisiensis TaxID=1096341 RepID=A0A4V3ES15_9CLOT|nr:hypothetical protein [Fonticella tunisiensis]TDT51262.1 hypothetical protein EDD71_12043 [Fonticella tunisiensis]